MKNVHRFRKSKGYARVQLRGLYSTEHYFLQPVYTAVLLQMSPGTRDYQRGLGAMRYYNDIESMKVEMDAIQLIITNSQLTYTGPALVKFQKILSVVNDHQN